MKTGQKFLTIVILSLVVIPGLSQSLDKLKAFTMTIHGGSTLHEWESKVVKAEWQGSVVTDNSKITDIPKSELKILVKDIQSEHGRIMDSKTYEAFNADRNPNITFSLKSISQSNTQVITEGNLTMNGTTKPVSITLNTKAMPNGDIQFSGSYSMKMTQFNMKPPTAMMGTIKVADDVTIKFDLTVTK